MAFCSQCGSPLPESARYCPECGTEIKNAPQITQPQAIVLSADPDAPPTLAAPPAVAPPSPGVGAGWILPVVLLLAVATIAVLLWSQRDSAQSVVETDAMTTADAVAPGKTPSVGDGQPSDTPTDAASAGDTTVTTASSLDSAFNADPQGARERYAGAVTLTGTIASMVTPGASPSLSLEGRTRFNFVLANFPAGSRAQLAPLTKGERITVTCAGVDQLVGTTILRDCALR